MRLFNRRKDLQNGSPSFDDPRLVGMGPLKTIDETINNKVGFSGNLSNSMMAESMENVYYLEDEKNEAYLRRNNHVRRSSSFMAPSSIGKLPFQAKHVPMYLPLQPQQHHHLQQQQQQQQIVKDAPVRKDSGGNSLSSWSRRVSVTWDNIRRSESTEGFFSSAGTLNRRKTLHIHQPTLADQLPESARSSTSTSRLAERVLAYREKFQTLRNNSSASINNKGDQPAKDLDTISKASSTPSTPRKLGRVQSLRLLLSRGKKNGGSSKAAIGGKVDKETDTEDLDSIYGSCNAMAVEGEQEDDMMMSNGNNNSRSRSFYQAYSSSITQIPTSTTTGYDPYPEEYYSLSSPITPTASVGCQSRQRRCSLADGSGTIANDFASFDPYFLMMKTTSCDNLSSISSTVNGGEGVGAGERYVNGLHKSTSTETVITPTSSSGGGNSAKRSSFPYAYIRSKLTALPEEPQAPGSPRVSKEETRKIPPRRSQSHRNLITGAPRHSSMGDLHSTRSAVSRGATQDEEYGVEEILHPSVISIPYAGSSSSGFVPRRRPCSIACPPGQRMFDPGFTDPTEEDDHFDKISLNSSSGGESHNSPRIWSGSRDCGSQRSFSIGDIRNNITNHGNHLLGSSTEVSSSGYDSDSTRNIGNESPRLSMAVVNKPCVPPPPRMMSDHRRSFDTVSTLSERVVDSSSSSGASSPTHSAVINEVVPSVSSTNYGPLAYVTLTRKPQQRLNKPNSSNPTTAAAAPILAPIPKPLSSSSGIICFTSSSTLLDNQVRSSTLPRRSQSSSCISTSPTMMVTSASKSDSTNNNNNNVDDDTANHLPIPPSIKKRQRKGSVDSSGSGEAVSRFCESINPETKGSRSRTQSLCLSIFSVKFEKGATKKSLGFSVVGGKDSPKGSMGIFIKRIFPYGQASEEGNITEGDEILSVNGQSLSSVTHTEALNIFKGIKSGEVVLQVARREKLD